MKRLVGFTFLVIWIFASGCGPKKIEVQGQVLIATAEGNKAGLGSTSVYVLNDEQYKAAFDTSQPATKRRLDSTIVSDSVRDSKNYATLSLMYQNIAKTWDGLAQKAIKNYGRYRMLALKKRADRCQRQAEENLGLSRMYASRAIIYADSSRHACFISTKESALKEFVYAAPDLISDTSDAGGIFKLVVPERSHHVVAFASRTVGDSTEEYFWDFPYTPGGGTLMLSNHNLTK